MSKRNRSDSNSSQPPSSPLSQPLSLPSSIAVVSAAEQARLERMAQLRAAVQQQDAQRLSGPSSSHAAADAAATMTHAKGGGVDNGAPGRDTKRAKKVEQGAASKVGGSETQEEDMEAEAEEEDDELDEEEQMEEMKRMMGFGGFNTTKGTKVEDNHTGAAKGFASVKTARKYRQYMNRKGGFDKPLDKI